MLLEVEFEPETEAIESLELPTLRLCNPRLFRELFCELEDDMNCKVEADLRLFSDSSSINLERVLSSVLALRPIWPSSESLRIGPVKKI